MKQAGNIRKQGNSPKKEEKTPLIILVILFIFFSIIIHEFAHALAAYMMGDPTAKDRGRLTLNPAKHIDLFGTIILPLMLYMIAKFSGAGVPVFGYAKPVPVNPSRFRYPRLFGAIVGFAGPFSNFCLAFLCAVLLIKFKLVKTDFNEPLLILLQLNLLLGIFNLIPIPPLDGSKILNVFLPESLARRLDRLGLAGFILILVLLQTNVFNKIYQHGTKYFLTFIDRIF